MLTTDPGKGTEKDSGSLKEHLGEVTDRYTLLGRNQAPVITSAHQPTLTSIYRPILNEHPWPTVTPGEEEALL